MEDEQIVRIEAFINDVIKVELGKIVSSGALFMQFVVMGQAIEVLGAMLDDKPMKAKGQSAKRFDNSVRVLFGGGYRVWNSNHYLYDKLRNQMTHAFIPGGDILLYNEERFAPGKHLTKHNGSLILAADIFYADICKAGDRLIMLIKSGKIKAKNIAYSNV